MWEIIQGFLMDTVNSLTSSFVKDMEAAIGDLLVSAFYIEKVEGLNSTILSPSTLNSMLQTLYGFMVLLLALKLLWKGWKVYVLWRDGESETPPGEMVLGALFAVVVAVAFPVIYDISVSVITDIMNVVFGAISGSTTISTDNILELALSSLTVMSEALIANICLVLIFIIVFIVLYFVILARGVEMLIYRLGVPLAVIGLVDSDSGIWKSYVQLFIRQMATTLVQYFCMVMGARIVAGVVTTGEEGMLSSSGINLTSIILGITFEIVAFSLPKLLSQVLAPGGGGMSQKVSTLTMVVRTFSKG